MRKLLLVFLVALFIGCIVLGCSLKNNDLGYTMPNLPFPIAKEKALITVAGQGIEGLVVAEICDSLKVSNTFSYKANETDLENKNSLIIVVGVSKLGMKNVSTDFETEKMRIDKLMKKANAERIPVIMVYLGKDNRWNKLNKDMIEFTFKNANYIVAVVGNKGEKFIRNIAVENNKLFTLVNDIERIKIPLNSAFR